MQSGNARLLRPRKIDIADLKRTLPKATPGETQYESIDAAFRHGNVKEMSLGKGKVTEPICISSNDDSDADIICTSFKKGPPEMIEIEDDVVYTISDDDDDLPDVLGESLQRNCSAKAFKESVSSQQHNNENTSNKTDYEKLEDVEHSRRFKSRSFDPREKICPPSPIGIENGRRTSPIGIDLEDRKCCSSPIEIDSLDCKDSTLASTEVPIKLDTVDVLELANKQAYIRQANIKPEKGNPQVKLTSSIEDILCINLDSEDELPDLDVEVIESFNMPDMLNKTQATYHVKKEIDSDVLIESDSLPEPSTSKHAQPSRRSSRATILSESSTASSETTNDDSQSHESDSTNEDSDKSSTCNSDSQESTKYTSDNHILTSHDVESHKSSASDTNNIELCDNMETANKNPTEINEDMETDSDSKSDMSQSPRNLFNTFFSSKASDKSPSQSPNTSRSSPIETEKPHLSRKKYICRKRHKNLNPAFKSMVEDGIASLSEDDDIEYNILYASDELLNLKPVVILKDCSPYKAKNSAISQNSSPFKTVDDLDSESERCDVVDDALDSSEDADIDSENEVKNQKASQKYYRRKKRRNSEKHSPTKIAKTIDGDFKHYQSASVSSDSSLPSDSNYVPRTKKVKRLRNKSISTKHDSQSTFDLYEPLEFIEQPDVLKATIDRSVLLPMCPSHMILTHQSTDDANTSVTSLIEKFNDMQINIIEAAFEEGDEFIICASQTVEEFTNVETQPDDNTRDRLFRLGLLEAPSMHVAITSYNTLRKIQSLHPWREPSLTLTWDDLDHIMSNIIMTDHSTPSLALYSNSQALTLLVNTIEEDFILRDPKYQKDISKSIAYRWLSAQNQFSNVRSVINWVSAVIKFDEFSPVSSGEKKTPEKTISNFPILPEVMKLLDLSIAVSSAPENCVGRIARALVGVYIYELSDTIQRSLLLQSIGSHALRFELARLSLEDLSSNLNKSNDDHNLKSLMDSYFTCDIGSICQTPPLTPNSEYSDDASLSTKATSNGELLILLLYTLIESYIIKERDRLDLSVYVRKKEVGKHRELSAEDREALRGLPRFNLNIEPLKQ
ncbi:unnamed protein product [Owenia fusiformis]|uniref:Uncharacterized protein n=1 Tax=Owenia fusiformis TaxID=6347 RepID=A0A8S4NWK5_OWEFU|nr:unnamed protein product [Owenia fusiformis]